MILTHKFVDTIPDEITDGIIYVSKKYGTVIHKCCCGCGNEVVTPISPTDWELTYDNDTISLYPSIGNWNLECRSHYWIKNSKVEWAGSWSDEQIKAGRHQDFINKQKYYDERRAANLSIWAKISNWWKNLYKSE